MRDIHLAQLDKPRPVLVLTREPARSAMRRVTVAPITSTIKGISAEVRVGPANGLKNESVVNCDNIATIDRDLLGKHIGFLFENQETDLAAAIVSAFALRAFDLY
jgi:mRNA interferase MazF